MIMHCCFLRYRLVTRIAACGSPKIMLILFAMLQVIACEKICLVHVRFRTDVLRTPSTTQQGANSWPSDHDSTSHDTETPALTTWPSVTSEPGKKLIPCLRLLNAIVRQNAFIDWSVSLTERSHWLQGLIDWKISLTERSHWLKGLVHWKVSLKRQAHYALTQCTQAILNGSSFILLLNETQCTRDDLQETVCTVQKSQKFGCEYSCLTKGEIMNVFWNCILHTWTIFFFLLASRISKRWIKIIFLSSWVFKLQF